MNKIHRHSERIFEQIASGAIAILSNPFAFVLALALVIFWLTQQQFYTQDIYESIRDFVHAATFLSLFVIQKSFNRFSASLHLKVNELVKSHEPASNLVINAEERTEHEIIELSKEYVELAELAKEEFKEKTEAELSELSNEVAALAEEVEKKKDAL